MLMRAEIWEKKGNELRGIVKRTARPIVTCFQQRGYSAWTRKMCLSELDEAEAGHTNLSTRLSSHSTRTRVEYRPNDLC